MLILPQNSPENAGAARELARRVEAVRAAIARAAGAAGRSVDSVTLLAVSKGQGADVVRQAVRCGLTQFGENYLAEAAGKMDALADPALTWHFIGRVQSNKTREIAARFDWVHGVDRLSIAQRLSRQRGALRAPLNVCVQVRVASDPDRVGIAPEQAAALLQEIAPLPHLRVRGLMCMLPLQTRDPAAQLATFGQVRELLRSPALGSLNLDTLSMGMSADFAPAIAAGATIVRIGTALFGPRPRT